jgi:hypothetical protein
MGRSRLVACRRSGGFVALVGTVATVKVEAYAQEGGTLLQRIAGGRFIVVGDGEGSAAPLAGSVALDLGTSKLGLDNGLPAGGANREAGFHDHLIVQDLLIGDFEVPVETEDKVEAFGHIAVLNVGELEPAPPLPGLDLVFGSALEKEVYLSLAESLQEELMPLVTSDGARLKPDKLSTEEGGIVIGLHVCLTF